MARPTVLIPAESSRIVQDDHTVVLVGQPPEILKSLLLNKIFSFDALLLTDIKEKDGAMMNNLEFPFYFFVFVAKGLEQGKKLKLIGENSDISHALRLLRITLMGPTREELDRWETPTKLKEEWLSVSDALAVKDKNGKTIPLEDFFELIPFQSGRALVDDLVIDHVGLDRYKFSNAQGNAVVDLNDVNNVLPPYSIPTDYVPGGLVKLGIEVLGGASGFSVDEACTGLALCYNGDYLLIDSIPFLDMHLHARGISKNQISAVFLTHLHDDHCTMFPLMMMPHRVEIITTREIFNMAMDKLACNLGWNIDVVTEHFKLVEVHPGESLNYYGLVIKPHLTVHTIPTIGATFTMKHKDSIREICIIGDNNSLASATELNSQGHLRDETLKRLTDIYTDPIHLLVADGGAGDIHGEPADALLSQAERVVFVHVETLSEKFSTTFSLAASGKRYTAFEGDESLYISQVSHYLGSWLDKPFPNRWMRSLMAEAEIRRYNAQDVVVAQNFKSQGNVYLILTGYCNVVRHDGEKSISVAELQAGDLIGEMSVVTGSGKRNASVVAATPVTICVFTEEIFGSFITSEKYKNELMARWAIRPSIRALPQFANLTSTVSEKIARKAEIWTSAENETVSFDTSAWNLLIDGEVKSETNTHTQVGSEFGWRPLATDNAINVTCLTEATFVSFGQEILEQLRMETPQLNYVLRKLRIQENDPNVNWILDLVDIY